MFGGLGLEDKCSLSPTFQPGLMPAPRESFTCMNRKPQPASLQHKLGLQPYLQDTYHWHPWGLPTSVLEACLAPGKMREGLRFPHKPWKQTLSLWAGNFRDLGSEMYLKGNGVVQAPGELCTEYSELTP